MCISVVDKLPETALCQRLYVYVIHVCIVNVTIFDLVHLFVFE